MINLELNSTTALKEVKVFIGQVFLQKVRKKTQVFFIQFVDILMILLIKTIKIKLVS